MKAMEEIVLFSASWQRGKLLPAEPCALSLPSLSSPSEFEVIFYSKGIRYQYGIAISKEKVEEEWLYAFSQGALTNSD